MCGVSSEELQITSPVTGEAGMLRGDTTMSYGGC